MPYACAAVIRSPSFFLALAVVGALAAAAEGQSPSIAPMRSSPACAVPLQFVPNRGQWDESVRFAAIGNTAGWLHDDGFTLRYERWSSPDGVSPGSGTRGGSHTSREQTGCVVRTRFVGTAAPTFAMHDELPTHHHFLRGNDRRQWRRNVPAFARVAMSEVLPGIDVMFRPLANGSVGAFEYDLLLAPGAQLQGFVARCEGVESLHIDGDGALCARLSTPDGPAELRQQPPIAWQDTPTGRRPLRVAFRLLDATSYGFVAEGLDASLAAVVDPGVVWGTLIGGGATDSVRAIRWLPGVAVWAAGWSGSTDFPTTPGAFRTTGSADGFIARFRDDGTQLLDATYLGGSSNEEVRGLALGPDNSITVVGFTRSTNFPTTPSALLPTYSGSSPFLDVGDAFVSRLDSTGSTLLASTYLGGAFDDIAEAVDVDSLGNAVVVGWTSSPNFPVTPGCFQPALGGLSGIQSDGFISKLAANGQSLLWSTHLGGLGAEQLLAVDREPITGDVVVAGWSLGFNYPTTPGAYRTVSGGGLDGVVARVASDGQSLVFSTFVGGSEDDVLQALRVDPTDSTIWVGGFSLSADFPTTPGAPQTTLAGLTDAVLVHLPSTGQSLAFSTLLGGVGAEKLRGLDVNAVGVIVVGEAGAGFPVSPDAPQPLYAGGNLDGFTTFFSDGGASLAWSTYFGGADQDVFSCVELDAGGRALIGGWTFSTDVPIGTGGYQTTLRGVEDGCVMQVAVLNGIEITSGSGSELSFDGPGSMDLLVARLRNRSLNQIAVDSVRVLVAGAGDAVARTAALRVLRSDPSRPTQAAVQVAGPITLLGDDREIEVALTGVTLAPDETALLTVVAEVVGQAGATIEVAAAVVDASAWRFRALGAAAGTALPIQGGGRIEGPIRVLGVLSGDADGDRGRTVVDVRRLIGRIGSSDAAVDCDGDGTITSIDAMAVREALLGRTTVFGVPSQWLRGTWTTMRLLAPNPVAVQATLGGLPLRVGRTTPREVTLQPTSAHATGMQRLLVTLAGRVLVDTLVDVQ